MFSITIIGSGVVGQATGKELARIGNKITFCDINLDTLAKLKQQKYQTCLPKNISKYESEIYILTTPTPTIGGKVKLDYLKKAVINLAKKVLKNKKSHSLVVIKSTVPPGTTNHFVIPLLEKYSGKKAGKDFDVAMNPEYLREKTAFTDFQNPKLTLLGIDTPRAENILKNLYSPYAKKCPIVPVKIIEAEMQKYVHNLWNATKISFFNEMRTVTETLHLDSDKIFNLTMTSAEASWNLQYGTRNFGPFSGMCLPKDTQGFLTWSKQYLNIKLPLLKSVIIVNDNLIAQERKRKKKSEDNFIDNINPVTFLYLKPKFAGEIAKKNKKMGQ